MKKNTLDYINEIYTGGYKNALTYVNSVSPVIVEEPGEDPGEEPDSGPDYLCFTSTGESSINMKNYKGNAPVLFYSMDKENWVSWDYSLITLNDGESVYFYGENPDGINKNLSVYSRFLMYGSLAASGNIQTLLSKKGDRTDVTAYCYYFLFEGCKSLTVAPELPATTLAESCYMQMFQYCESLTVAPNLPATTLAESCYNQMFLRCYSLTVGPELPATTLVDSCYFCMFCYCSVLESVKTHCVDWNTEYAREWLYDTGYSATNPTVYCPADSTITSSDFSGIPSNWTRADLQ